MEADPKHKEIGKFIIAIRLNSIPHNTNLIRKKLINESWVDRCLICEETNSDKIDHWLFDCYKLEEPMAELMSEIIGIFMAVHDDKWREALLSHILLSNIKPKLPKELLDKYNKKITTFILKLIGIRQKKIATLIVNKYEAPNDWDIEMLRKMHIERAGGMPGRAEPPAIIIDPGLSTQFLQSKKKQH